MERAEDENMDSNNNNASLDPKEKKLKTKEALKVCNVFILMYVFALTSIPETSKGIKHEN
jgi:hypothetical protein